MVNYVNVNSTNYKSMELQNHYYRNAKTNLSKILQNDGHGYAIHNKDPNVGSYWKNNWQEWRWKK